MDGGDVQTKVALPPSELVLLFDVDESDQPPLKHQTVERHGGGEKPADKGNLGGEVLSERANSEDQNQRT